MDSYSFSKVNRLCSSRRIESLFFEGERFYEFPFKTIWQEEKNSETHLKLAVSVPKKRLPKASQRNHVKRLIREAYRKNKSIILPTLQQKNKSINVMIVYTLPSILSYSEIEDKISVTLQRLSDEV